MRITVTTEQGDVISLDIDSSLDVSSLKALVEAESGIAAEHQQLYRHGQALSDPQRTLASYGLKMDDVLVVRSTSQTPPAADEAEQLRQSILQDPTLLQRMAAQQPELVEAAMNDPEKFRRMVSAIAEGRRRRELERAQQMDALDHADPFDIEAQRKIEEMIRLQNIQANMETALEYNPEAFGRVIMLYIDCEVNGHPIKAFVDSGAQATIISPECAEKCGLMHLCDTRFAGIARGVGTAKILGRVHAATIKLGRDPDHRKNLYMQCSFTVMEGKGVDLLLGLDNLKRFQACIDLAKNVLRIGDAEIPFLAEKDLPESARMLEAASPTSPTDPNAPSSTTSPTAQPLIASPSKKASSPNTAKSATANATAAASSGSRTTQAPSAALQQLMALGATRQQAQAALEAAGGNVDVAAGFLFGGE